MPQTTRPRTRLKPLDKRKRMIESCYWKEELQRIAQNLRPVLKPPRWSEKRYCILQRDLAVGAGWATWGHKGERQTARKDSYDNHFWQKGHLKGHSKRKRGYSANCNLLFLLARPDRFELPTPWFEARYSIQLSYGRMGCCSIL